MLSHKSSVKIVLVFRYLPILFKEKFEYAVSIDSYYTTLVRLSSSKFQQSRNHLRHFKSIPLHEVFMRPMRRPKETLKNILLNLQILFRRPLCRRISGIDDSANSVAGLGRLGAIVDGTTIPNNEIARLGTDFQWFETFGREPFKLLLGKGANLDNTSSHRPQVQHGIN